MSVITLAHGSGGRMTQELIARHIIPHFHNELLSQMEDSTVVRDIVGPMAVTCDGFTVAPLDFPGGDIGKLAVCGSVNDLAVRGARPLYLTMGLIIEEGLESDSLERYMRSAAQTASYCGIKLIAGDTKVVHHGSGGELYISMTGIGCFDGRMPLSQMNLRDGDILVVTGSIGEHGGAILSAREEVFFPEPLKSDCAPLWWMVEPLLALPGLRCMRDLTRGGLSSAVCEWAETAGVGILLEEKSISVSMQVKSLCDVFGFDPMTLACEGRTLIAISPEDSQHALDLLHKNQYGVNSVVIGKITDSNAGRALLKTTAGGLRIVDMPAGEILPRIC